LRCADAARLRGEPLIGSAVRYSRFLLLEVPGPWGTSALAGRHMEAGVARQLASAAAASGTPVLLTRRAGQRAPGGSGDGDRAMAWALADTSSGVERVLWGSWRDPADLLGLDLSAVLPDTAGATGPQRLALVCTNGKRDQCCALRGRPVAAAVAAVAGWDTWECSHLGGHRFAATMMLLPSGDMFGALDEESAVEVMRRFDAGELMLSHYRGRCGQLAPVQAALHAAAVRLGDFRRGAVRVARFRSLAAGDGGGRSLEGVTRSAGRSRWSIGPGLAWRWRTGWWWRGPGGHRHSCRARTVHLKRRSITWRLLFPGCLSSASPARISEDCGYFSLSSQPSSGAYLRAITMIFL
jgi:Sucrase/ferredoxin-like